MARPVKWSRDLHLLRERAARSRTETWGRREIEDLFGVGRASAQSLMKAIGQVQPVGGAHFVERISLLSFLDAVIEAPSVEAGMRSRVAMSEPPPRHTSMKVSLPNDLRSVMLPDLPSNVTLAQGRLEIVAPTAVAMVESLVAVAMAMRNDLDSFRIAIEPPFFPPKVEDEDLRRLFSSLRSNASGGEHA